jgi:hypothetical protein
LTGLGGSEHVGLGLDSSGLHGLESFFRHYLGEKFIKSLQNYN